MNNIGIGKTNPRSTSKLDIVGTTTMTNTTALNLDIVKTSTTVGDLLNMRYDATNGSRYQQAYVAANDVKYNVIAKNNNVDTNMLTYYKGNIGIGTSAPAATDKLSVSGNTKITGTRVAISNILFTPQSLPRAIIRGYLLGSNDGTTWEAVYTEFTVTSWTTTAERSLLPSGYTPNTKQDLYYRLVARQIQGVTTGGLGVTEKLAIATLRLTYNQNVAFVDSVLCIGDPVGGTTPAANCILDVNGTTNIQGSTSVAGNLGVGVTDTVTYKLNVGGTVNTSGIVTTTSNKIGINGASPTLYLRHTTQKSVMIHCNSNLLYFLGGPAGGDITADNWAYAANNLWPLTINLTNNEAVFGGNVNVQSLNNIGVSDFLWASQNVFFSKADYCRYETATVYTSYSSSQFTINANFLRSEYYRPGVQWRWFIGLSNADAGRVFSWGFWCVIYDEYYNAFSDTRLAGSTDVLITTNWDGSGWNRCIITIINGNPAYLLNVNIS